MVSLCAVPRLRHRTEDSLLERVGFLSAFIVPDAQNTQARAPRPAGLYSTANVATGHRHGAEERARKGEDGELCEA